MNCKFCNAPMEDGSTVCPVCGQDNGQPEPAEPMESTEPVEPIEPIEPVEPVEPTEPVEPVEQAEPADEATAETPPEKPKKKGVVARAIAAVLCGAVLLGVLSFALLKSLGVNIRIPKNDLYRKSSYTASNPAKTGSRVVAKAGGVELTNSQLQIHYWSQVYDFLDYYGAYASQVGMDIKSPLDKQNAPGDEEMTWQQYFLKYALESWHRYETLVLMGQEQGMELDETTAQMLEALPQDIESVAKQNGYESADALIAEQYGAGVTAADYVEYMRTYYYALQYFNMAYEAINPTQEELDAYYQEHEADFIQGGATKDSGNWVDARHILIMPKGGTKDEDGNTVYSDEEWETCRASAQAILDEWLAGDATEDSFAELANEHSEDPGSNTKGGLYTQWKPTDSLMQEYKDWIFDESRKPGPSNTLNS